MSIVQRSRGEIDKAKPIAELTARQPRAKHRIEAQVAEDAVAWSDADLAEAAAAAVRPRPGR